MGQEPDALIFKLFCCHFCFSLENEKENLIFSFYLNVFEPMKSQEETEGAGEMRWNDEMSNQKN